MRTPRLFLDLPLSENQILELPSARAHYLLNVLRLQPGRSLLVFNGLGGEFNATLQSATKKNATVHLGSILETLSESPLHTELAIGVSKGDRMDWIVQKATELGVSVISPLLTERSEIKLNTERWEKKLNHWREVIISACEQCGRNRLPILNPAQPLPEFLKLNVAETKLVLDPNPSDFSLMQIQSPKSIAVLIGPEGGFSAEEVSQAKESGFMGWSLGPRILRTETAPVAALSILQSYWGDIKQ